jgi:DNA polymerase III subunit delta'
MPDLDPPEQHDTLPGVSAPVLTRQLHGQNTLLEFLCASYRGGRLHHALLFEGPHGIGKATAAFHLAQHLLASPVASDAPQILQLLDEGSDDFRQLVNGTHLQVLHLSRPFDSKTEKFKTMLTVDEVRRIGHFLSRTNTGAGYRVVIIDPAEDMNAAAANALLKNLEEPPARTIFILISHRSGRLLPTIRSRCQAVRFNALGPDDLKSAITAATSLTDAASNELLSLSEGSVRRALTLYAFGGLEIVRSVDQLIEAQTFDADKAAKLGDAMAGRDADIQYQLLIDYLASKIATGASLRADTKVPHLALQLSQLHRETGEMLREAQVYNLDRKQTIFGLIANLHAKFSAGLL